MRAGMAILLVSAAATACASDNEAPVVYGSQPTAQARIYSSRNDLPPAPAAEIGRAGALDRLADELRTTAVDEGRLLEDLIEPAATVEGDGRRLAAVTADDIYLEDTLAGASSRSRTRVADAGYVRVISGDTIYAISRRTGASPQAIIEANGLRAPYRLDVGQTLRLPDGARRTAAAAAPAAPADRPAKADGARIEGAAPPSKPTESDPTVAKPTVAKPTVAKIEQPSIRQASGQRRHVVRSGDTLYAISRATGVSVATLASANDLRAPYALQIGDEIALPTDGTPILANATAPAATERSRVDQVSFSPAPEVAAASGLPLFDWPVKGSVVAGFRPGAPGERNDGIDISAPVGTPVRAAADGEVVYRGAGLDGYGNLLLIRHADGFVTAYAHNDVMLVRKGQQVRKGQVISKVGQTGATERPQLHFEIRQNLKAVDPMGFLGS